MTPNGDIQTCMALLGRIQDPKVRYYWLKLGESLAQSRPKPKPAAKPKAKRKT